VAPEGRGGHVMTNLTSGGGLMTAPVVSALDSWELVAAAQRGEKEAFGSLYRRYRDLVYRYLMSRTGNRADAEDLTSETFARALRSIGSVAYQGRDVGAWLITIARNLWTDQVKSSRCQRETLVAEFADAVSDTDGPESRAMAAATAAEVGRHLAQLHDNWQEVLRLRFWQGLSIAETTAAIGAPSTGAVKATQHRAVQRLATLVTTAMIS